MVTGQLQGEHSTVTKYLEEEGLGLLSEDFDIPGQNEWGEYIDQETFTGEADLFYGHTQEDLQYADPGWGLINLKLGKWNQQLKDSGDILGGSGDLMGAIKDNTEEIRGHTAGFSDLVEGQERMIEELEQIAEHLEEPTLQ